MFKTAQKNIFIFSFSFNALSQKKIPPCRKKRYPNEFRVKAGVVTPQLLELTQDLNTHTAVLYCTVLTVLYSTLLYFSVQTLKKKSRIRDTLTLSACADFSSSTNKIGEKKVKIKK